MLYREQTDNGKPESALIQQVATRWNSMYDMIKRIIQNNEEIERILDHEKSHRKFIIEQIEIAYLKSACEVLEPFKYLTEKLSVEKTCSSNYVIPGMSLLLNNTYCESGISDANFTSLFKSLIHNRVKFYNTKYEIMNDDELAVACFTNPKTKHFPHAIEDEKYDLVDRAKESIIKYFNENIGKFNENELIANGAETHSKSQLEKQRLGKKYDLDDSDCGRSFECTSNIDQLNKQLDR